MAIFNDIDGEPNGGEASSSVALTRLAAADVAAPAAPELPVDALARLPELGVGGGDPYWRLVSAFLVGYPPHSRARTSATSRPGTPGARRRRAPAAGAAPSRGRANKSAIGVA